MQKFFANKTVLITGAAGGIGRQLALDLSKLVKALILTDLNSQKLDELAFELKSNQALIKTFVVDVSKGDDFLPIIQEFASYIDIVIANAGLGGINPANSFDYMIDKKIMNVNYFGTINSFKPFIDSMIAKKSGHLVGICSLASQRGLPNAASYSASKAAQASLLESFRLDLAPFGVKVITVMPGFVKTAMTNHKEFDMPFMVEVEKASKIIINTIYKGKKLVRFPLAMGLLSILNRILPICIYDFLLPLLNGKKVKNSAKIFEGPNNGR